MRALEVPKWQQKNESKKRLWIGLFCVLLAGTVLSGLAFAWQKWGYSLLPGGGVEVTGNVINVKAGGDFQAALNKAKPGDMIILQAGAIYKGSFKLPNKTGSEFITIRTSAQDSQLPAGDTRLNPQKYASLLPKIVTTTSDSAINATNGSHHYRFIGVEITSDTNNYVYNMVTLGLGEQKSLAEVPYHFEFDRCYIHPGAKGKARRGIAMNSAETIVKNSYISGFGFPGEETQAIAGWSGPGPYKIINNHLEGGGQSVMFGGGDPFIKGLVPSDIEIKYNLMTKPLNWRGKVGLKCSFELKNARRVQIIGNIIENAFDENAMRITIRNQDGNAPWSTIEDVLFQNNIVRQSGGALLILGSDDTYKSQMMKRVKFINNLFVDLGGKWGAEGRFMTISNGEDIVLQNNTILNNSNYITAHSFLTKGFVFKDNIVSNNEYGLYGDDAGVGKPAIAKYFPASLIVNNVIVNNKNIPSNEVYVPPRNLAAQGLQAVGFVDLARGNYRLAGNSRFKGKSSTGKDPGCDIAMLETEMAQMK